MQSNFEFDGQFIQVFIVYGVPIVDNTKTSCEG